MEINLECSAIINEDYSQFFDANSQIYLNEDDAASLQNNSLLQTQNLNDIQNFQPVSTNLISNQPALLSQDNSSSPQKIQIFNLSSVSRQSKQLSESNQRESQNQQNSVNQSKTAVHPREDSSCKNLVIVERLSEPSTSQIKNLHMKKGSMAYEEKPSAPQQETQMIQKPLTQHLKKTNIFQKLNAGWTTKPTSQAKPQSNQTQEVTQVFLQNSNASQLNQNRISKDSPTKKIQQQTEEQKFGQITAQSNKKLDFYGDCFIGGNNQFDPFNLSEIQAEANNNQSELMISKYLDQTHQSPTDQEEICYISEENNQILITQANQIQDQHNLSPIKIQSYFQSNNQNLNTWKEDDLAAFKEMGAQRKGSNQESEANRFKEIELSVICAEVGNNQNSNQFNELSSIIDINQTNQLNQQEDRDILEQSVSQFRQLNDQNSQQIQRSAIKHRETDLTAKIENQSMIQNQSEIQKPNQNKIEVLNQEQESEQIKANQIQEVKQSVPQQPVAAHTNTAWQKVTFAKRRSSNNLAGTSLTQMNLQKQKSIKDQQTKVLNQDDAILGTNTELANVKPVYEIVGGLISNDPDSKTQKPIKMKKSNDILPVFDCLFCCQEHFVLNKINERALILKYANHIKHFIAQRDILTINLLMFKILPQENQQIEFIQFTQNLFSTSNLKTLEAFRNQSQSQIQLENGYSQQKGNGFIGFNELKQVLVKNVNQEFDTKVTRLLLEVDLLERKQASDNHASQQEQKGIQKSSKHSLREFLSQINNQKSEESSREKPNSGSKLKRDMYKVPQSIKLNLMLQMIKKQNEKKHARAALYCQEQEAVKINESRFGGNMKVEKFFADLSGAESMLMDENDEYNFFKGKIMTKRQKKLLKISFESEVFNIYDPYYTSQDGSRSIQLDDSESEDVEEELTDGEELDDSESYSQEQLDEYQEEEMEEDSSEGEDEEDLDNDQEEEGEMDSYNQTNDYDINSSINDDQDEESEIQQHLKNFPQKNKPGNLENSLPDDESLSDREMLNQLQLVKGISEKFQQDIQENQSEILEVLPVQTKRDDSFKNGKPPQSPGQGLKVQFQKQKRTSSSFKPQESQVQARNQQNTLSQNLSNTSQQNICGLSSIDQVADEEQEITQVPLRFVQEEINDEEEEFKIKSQELAQFQNKNTLSQEFNREAIHNNQSISQIRGDEIYYMNNDSLSQNGLGYIGIGTGITSISNINQTNDEHLMRKQSALSSGNGGNLIIQENYMIRDDFGRVPETYQMNLDDDEDDLMEDEDSERYTFGQVTPKNMLSQDLGDPQQRVTFSHNNGESSLSPVRATTNATLILHNNNLVPYPNSQNFQRQSHHPQLQLKPQRLQVQEEYYDATHKAQTSNQRLGQSSSMSNSSQTQNPLYLDISPVSCHQAKNIKYDGGTMKLNFNNDSNSQDEQQQCINQVNQLDPLHQRQNSLGKDEEEVLNTLRNRFDFYPAIVDQDSLDIQTISNVGLPNSESFDNQEQHLESNTLYNPQNNNARKKIQNKILSSIEFDEEQKYHLPFMRPSQYSYDQQQLMLSSSLQLNSESLEENFKEMYPDLRLQQLQYQQQLNQLNFSSNPSGYNQHAQPSDIINLNSITDASQLNLYNDLTSLSQIQTQLLEDKNHQSKSFTATSGVQKLNHQRLIPQNQIKLKLNQQQKSKLLLKQIDEQAPLSGILVQNQKKQTLTQAQVTPQTMRNAVISTGLDQKTSQQLKLVRETGNQSIEPGSTKQKQKVQKEQMNLVKKKITSSNSKVIKSKKNQVVRESVKSNHFDSFESGRDSYGEIAKQNFIHAVAQQNFGKKNFRHQDNAQISKNTASSVEYADDLLMLQQMTQTLSKNKRLEETKKKQKSTDSKKQGIQQLTQKLVRKESTQALCTPIDTHDAVYFNSNAIRNQTNGHPFSVKTSIPSNTTTHQNGRRQNNSNLGGGIQDSSKLMFLGNTSKNGTSSQANLLIMADILPQANNQLYTNRKFNNEFYSTKNMLQNQSNQLNANSRKNSQKTKQQSENYYNQGIVAKGSTSKNTSTKTLQQMTQSPISLTKVNNQGFFNNILKGGGSQSNANHLVAASAMPSNNLNLIAHLPITKKDFNMFMKNQILSSRYATTSANSNLPFNNLFQQQADINADNLNAVNKEIKTSQTQTMKKRRSNKFQGSTKVNNLAGVFQKEAREEGNNAALLAQAVQHTQSVQSTTNSKGLYNLQDFASTITSGGYLGTQGSMNGKKSSKGSKIKTAAAKKSSKKDKQVGKKIESHIAQQQQLQQDYYQQHNLLGDQNLIQQHQYQSLMNNIACNSMNFSNDYSIPSILGGMGGISNILPSANQQLDSSHPQISKQQSLSINNSRLIGQVQPVNSKKQKSHLKQSSQNDIQYLSMQDQTNLLGSIQFQGANNFSQINQISSIGGVNSSQGNTIIQPQLLMDQSSSNIHNGNNFFGQSTLIQAEMSTTCFSNGQNGTTINHTQVNPHYQHNKQKLQPQNENPIRQKYKQQQDPQQVNQTLPLSRKQPLIGNSSNQILREPQNFNTLSFTHPDEFNSNLIQDHMFMNPQMAFQLTQQTLKQKSGGVVISQNNQSLNLSSTNQSQNNTNLSSLTVSAAQQKQKNKQMLVEQVLQKQNSLQQQQIILQKQIQGAAIINQNRINQGESLQNLGGISQNYINSHSKIGIQQRVNNSIEEVSLFNLLKGLSGDSNYQKSKKEFNKTTHGHQQAIAKSIESKEDLLNVAQATSVVIQKKQPQIKAEAVKKNKQILNQVRQQSNQSIRSNSITNGNALAQTNWQSNNEFLKQQIGKIGSSQLNNLPVQAASLERNSQAPSLVKHGSVNDAKTGYQLSFVSKVNQPAKGPHSSQFSFSQQKNLNDLPFGPQHILQSMDAIEKEAASEQIIRNQAFAQTLQLLNKNAKTCNQSQTNNNLSSVVSTVKNSSQQPIRKKGYPEKRTRSTSKSQGQQATINQNQEKTLTSNPSVRALQTDQVKSEGEAKIHSHMQIEEEAFNTVKNSQVLKQGQHIISKGKKEVLKVKSKAGGYINVSNNNPYQQISKQGSIKTSFIANGLAQYNPTQCDTLNAQLQTKQALEQQAQSIEQPARNSVSVSQSLEIQSSAQNSKLAATKNTLNKQKRVQNLQDNVILEENNLTGAKEQQMDFDQKYRQQSASLANQTSQKKKVLNINQGNLNNLGSGNMAFQSELNKLYGTGKIMMSQVTSPLRSLMNASVQSSNQPGMIGQQQYSQLMSFSHVPNERKKQ